MDSELNMSHHISNIVSRFSKRLQFLKYIAGLSWGPDVMTLRMLYTHWIRPVAEYGAIFVAMASPAQLDLLDKLQTSCIGAILGCTTRASRTAMEVHSHIPPLGLRRLKLAARFIAHALRFPINHPTRMTIQGAPSPYILTPKTTHNKPLNLNLSLPYNPSSPLEILLSSYQTLALHTDE